MRGDSPPNGVVLSLSIRTLVDARQFVEQNLPSLACQQKDDEIQKWQLFFLIFAESQIISFLSNFSDKFSDQNFHFQFVQCDFKCSMTITKYAYPFRPGAFEKLGFLYAQKLNVNLHFSNSQMVYKKNFLTNLSREIKRGHKVVFVSNNIASKPAYIGWNDTRSSEGGGVTDDLFHYRFYRKKSDSKKHLCITWLLADEHNAVAR